MKWASAIIGMPFSLEGFAFFTEAISSAFTCTGGSACRRAHPAAGVMVAFSQMISGVFVVIANSWMNTPVGFSPGYDLPDAIDPIASLRCMP